MNRRQLLKSMGAGASILALAACAPAAVPSAAPSTSSDSGAAAPAAEATTITFWSSFTAANAEAEAALVEKFNEEMAGEVALDYQFQGSGGLPGFADQRRCAPRCALLDTLCT
jgi:ABC-type glycerol-3-phosphate transport system substrate-binding protein